MTQKQKKETTIADFNNHKVLLRLQKSRSPLSVLVCTDDLPDEWFVDIVEYKTKSHVVTNVSTVTKKDVQSRIDWYEKNGWTRLTNV